MTFEEEDGRTRLVLRELHPSRDALDRFPSAWKPADLLAALGASV